MTRIFSRCILLCLPFFLLGHYACHKDKVKTTVIHGVITDAKTELPIPGAIISYGVFDGGQSAGSGQHITGLDGKFTIEIGINENFSGLSIQREGYVSKHGLGMMYEPGTVNNMEIKMYPKDGTLKLVIENTSTQPDSVYVGIYSLLRHTEFSIAKGIVLNNPFIVQGLTEQQMLIDLTSEETIDVYWDFSPMQAANIRLAPFHAPVFILQNDTTVFRITL